MPSGRVKRSSAKARGVPRVVVVAARFHASITDSLLSACLTELRRLGIPDSQVLVIRVPGAFEIPVTVMRASRIRSVGALIALGAIVRGQTFHYDLVALETARGLQQAALASGKPVIFEVLAADTLELCRARALEGDSDNKGASAARAAVEMMQTLKELPR